MTPLLCRQLTAILLLVVVLLAPFNSIAHHYAPGAMQDACACQMPHGDAVDSNGANTEHCPDNDTGDCCDHEECCSDAIEPPSNANIVVRIPQKQFFSLNNDKKIPEVYLAIIVPPES